MASLPPECPLHPAGNVKDPAVAICKVLRIFLMNHINFRIQQHVNIQHLHKNNTKTLINLTPSTNTH